MARKDEINALARKFYSMHGCSVPEGYDFSAAAHPQERGMWNLAEVAVDYSRRKTREAIENAARRVEDLPDGTWGDESGERSPWPIAAAAVRGVTS